MQSGEDIMASMFEQEDSEQIQLNDPMRLVFRRMPTGQTVMMMMPWLPIELIKENSALVYTSDIVTVIEPKEAMIRYYDKLVERTERGNQRIDCRGKRTLVFVFSAVFLESSFQNFLCFSFSTTLFHIC